MVGTSSEACAIQLLVGNVSLLELVVGTDSAGAQAPLTPIEDETIVQTCR